MSDQTNSIPLQPMLVPFASKGKSKIAQLDLNLFPADEDLLGPAPSREFIQDILERGQTDSITVNQIGKNEYFIIDGIRRIKAFRVLGKRFPENPAWQTIRAEIVEVEDKAAVLAASASNNRRSDNPLTDLRAIRMVLDSNPHATIPEIANATGMPIGRVKNRMRLENLTPELFDAFVAGRMTAKVAEEAAKLPTAFQNKLLPKLLTKKPITMEDVVDTQRTRVAQTFDQAQLVLPGLPTIQPVEYAPAYVQPEDACPAFGWSVVDTQYNHLVAAIEPEKETAISLKYDLVQANPDHADTIKLCKIVLVDEEA